VPRQAYRTAELSDSAASIAADQRTGAGYRTAFGRPIVRHGCMTPRRRSDEDVSRWLRTGGHRVPASHARRGCREAHSHSPAAIVARSWSRRAASRQGQAVARLPRAAPRRAESNRQRRSACGIAPQTIRLVGKAPTHPVERPPNAFGRLPARFWVSASYPLPLRRSPHGTGRSAPSRDKPCDCAPSRPAVRASVRGAAAPEGRSYEPLSSTIVWALISTPSGTA
jgi:hypothetical protein